MTLKKSIIRSFIIEAAFTVGTYFYDLPFFTPLKEIVAFATVVIPETFTIQNLEYKIASISDGLKITLQNSSIFFGSLNQAPYTKNYLYQSNQTRP